MSTPNNIVLINNFGEQTSNQIIGPIKLPLVDGGVSGANLYSGTGVPNFAAEDGDYFFRKDPSSAATSLYINTAAGNNWTPVGGAAGVAWGAITGTLSAQTDLQTALNTKVDKPLRQFGSGNQAMARDVDIAIPTLALNGLPASKTCRVTYQLAFKGPTDAGAYIRQYNNYPGDMVGIVWSVPVFNAGATQTTLTPANGSQSMGIGTQLGAEQICLSEIKAIIKTGPLGGDLSLTLRSVAGAADATFLGDYSLVELEVLN